MNTNELPDMRDSDGEVRLTFIWDTESHYEDEEEDNLCDHEEEYIGKTWQEACDNAADCYDWDDEDCINFDAKSDLCETTRSLDKILIQEDGKEEVEADPEVHDYYSKAEEKAMGF